MDILLYRPKSNKQSSFLALVTSMNMILPDSDWYLSLSGRFGLDILDVDLLNHAVEFEGRFLTVVKRNR